MIKKEAGGLRFLYQLHGVKLADGLNPPLPDQLLYKVFEFTQ